MKIYFYIVLVVLLVSCKSKAVVSGKDAAPFVEMKEEVAVISEKIIQNQYNGKNDFSTLYIKSSANYRDEKQSQKVAADIKIKKGQMILVSVKFLGITMAKALITPEEVKYYEKINGVYFEGDYQKLSQWLGTDLDFIKIQNILTGQPIDDMQKSSFAVGLDNNLYRLGSSQDANTFVAYFFDVANFAFKKQQITQLQKNRELQITYPDYRKYGEMSLPLSLVIEAKEKENKTNISIEYQTVTLNEELSFPYSVPEGYERISIN
ncbi:MAG: DUF4292 domain-containing protein [Flavobacterium sp.]